MDEYKVSFFYDPETEKAPVQEYLNNVSDKERAKILKYIEFLREHKGVLDEPNTKHIRDKIRELRIDFGRKRHRIFFFTFVGKNIVLLHAFQKHAAQTPEREILKALSRYYQVMSNPELYE